MHSQKTLRSQLTFTAIFDAMIMEVLFQSKAFISPMRLINGNTWRSAPASLRERYLVHLFTSRRVNPNVFADLGAPVFVRELDRLHLIEGQPEADALVRRWCSLSMHELWNLSWVVAHNRKNYCEHQARIRRHCQFMSGKWASLSDTDAAAIRRRTAHNTCFLRVAMHIIADEQNAALQWLSPTSSVDPDELNYCFGTTILGVAVQWGSEVLIRRLLERVPTTNEQTLGVYLRIAGRRSQPESYAISALLLKHFRDIASTRAVLLQRIFFKAIRVAQYEDRKSFSQKTDVIVMRRDSKAVFDNVLRWVGSKPAVHGMLPVLQDCYLRLSDRWGMPGKEHKRQHLFDQGTSSPGSQSTAPQDLIPAFMYGRYYRHATTKEVVQACRQWETHFFNCPCPNIDYGSSCACRHMLSKRCTCFTRLLGYRLPDYEWARPGKILFEAASRGLIHWVDWLLWAGADASNKPIEESLLFWARRGKIQNEVARLLVRHGRDLTALTVCTRPSGGSRATRRTVPQFVEQMDEGPMIELEVWAAGSEHGSPWSAIANPYLSTFWAAGQLSHV